MIDKTLHFDRTIENWDEALPLGNGDIGCLIWNKSNSLRLSLDKGGIWDCSEPPDAQENFTYFDIRSLIEKKKFRKIVKKYDDCYGAPTPTKLPAGKLILDLGIDENIVSDLDILSAQATLHIGDVTLRSFVHASEKYGMVEINKTDVAMRVDNPQYGEPKKPKLRTLSRETVQLLKNLHYPKARFVCETEDDVEYQYFVQPTNDIYYGIVAAKREFDGKTSIAYTVGFGKSDDFVGECKKTVGGAVLRGYDSAVRGHIDWWREYWSKSSITLPDKKLEWFWYLNNYFLGCCSRKNCFPMPLQGVWTADNGSLPPWKGDYHHDLNTQMSYGSYLKSNRLEQGECFIDYLLDMSDAGRRFAKNFYGVDGICLPSVMDIEGHALGGWCQYALSPTNQLWLCHIMARYWLFTRSDEYFEKIYAYMNEVGRFLLGLLKEENGVYKLPLSTSPEIHDNSEKSWLTPNSNYDLALMRAFMQDMITLSDEAGNKNASDAWRTHLKKLEPLAVNSENVLMLSPDESLKESHRHHSHCMSVYPLATLEYDSEKNRKIIDSTVNDLEKLGKKYWVGYSLGWMAQLYIAQGNGEKCRDMLHMFFDCCCTDNGFHVNGDFKKQIDFAMKYRLFTLEGNFLATDAVQNMLMYSENGKLKLFPAVPNEWKDASFESFRGFGGILVSAKLSGGKITGVRIKATADCSVELLDDLSAFGYEPNTVLVLKRGEETVME